MQMASLETNGKPEICLQFNFDDVQVRLDMISPSPSTKASLLPVVKSVSTASSPRVVARIRELLSIPTDPPVNTGWISFSASKVVFNENLVAMVEDAPSMVEYP